MQKVKVGIFFGGASPEHEISIISAKGIIENIDTDKFVVKEIYIDRNGMMWSDDDVMAKIKDNKAGNLVKLNLNNLKTEIDVAFPVLHGEGGEDGTIQGFLRTLNIPLVGCDVAASAICLDKGFFNELMDVNNIVQPKYVVFDFIDKSYRNKKIEEIKALLSLPLFIKPARTGSSIGISKVKDFTDLATAIEKAKEFDDKVVVEESVENCSEVEVSVLGDAQTEVKVSVPGKIIPAAEFYDYDDKYKDNNTKFEVPVKLSEEKIKEIQQLAEKAYIVSGCEGLARVDFLLDEENKVYLNEINTMPGFTPISMYPKLWEASGLQYKELITKLIELAIKRT